MMTECNRRQLEFSSLGRRKVTVDFDAGHLSSDAGGVLLREVDQRIGLLARLAQCFADHRNQSAIEHPVRDLVAQRIYALALGYEDLNDHNHLRADPLLALLVGKEDLAGGDRRRLRDKGNPLASPSALNRLELSRPDKAPKDRYRRIAANFAQLDDLLAITEIPHFCIVAQRLCQSNGPAKMSVNGFALLLPADGAHAA